MISKSLLELLRDILSGTAKEYSNGLTFPGFLLLSGEEYGTTVSLIGIAPLTRNRLNFMSLFWLQNCGSSFEKGLFKVHRTQ